MADPGTLLEPLIPALRRYAYALVRNRDLADDLVQDTLERALSRWYLRRRDGELRAWLFTILRNLYINGYRRSRRRGTQTAIDDHAESVATAATQDSTLEVRDVLVALDELPEEQKSLLLLVGIEDLSYDEAARVMDVPIGTVMSRLSRARQRLRSILEPGAEVGRVVLRRVK